MVGLVLEEPCVESFKWDFYRFAQYILEFSFDFNISVNVIGTISAEACFFLIISLILYWVNNWINDDDIASKHCSNGVRRLQMLEIIEIFREYEKSLIYTNLRSRQSNCPYL